MGMLRRGKPIEKIYTETLACEGYTREEIWSQQRRKDYERKKKANREKKAKTEKEKSRRIMHSLQQLFSSSM